MRVPAGGIGAAEAMQHLLRDIERQVGAGDLDRENDEVDVIEKIQIGMPDIEHRQPRRARAGRRALLPRRSGGRP